ncbi:hypothetical protein Bbelb_060690 [Branchiostoma belcheri]|nr:hypothetical protein Bbelb_060690 [Branchiostoma belcheri]
MGNLVQASRGRLGSLVQAPHGASGGKGNMWLPLHTGAWVASCRLQTAEGIAGYRPTVKHWVASCRLHTAAWVASCRLQTARAVARDSLVQAPDGCLTLHGRRQGTFLFLINNVKTWRTLGSLVQDPDACMGYSNKQPAANCVWRGVSVRDRGYSNKRPTANRGDGS